MIIGCSECGTRYVVGPQAIGKDGRRVKCSKCNNVWFQEPAPDDHEIVPEPETLASKEAEKETPAQEGKEKPEAGGDNKQQAGDKKPDDDPLGIFGGDVRRNVPVVVKERNYKLVVGWIALVIFVAGIIGALYYFRRDIERSSEFAETLYEKWDALVLKENQQLPDDQPSSVSGGELHPSTFLTMRQSPEVRLENGTPSLFIATEISNSSSSEIQLPPMLGVIRDAAGIEIFSWSQSINPSVVPADGILQFEVIVDNIPAETAEAELVFQWSEGDEN